MLLTIDRAQAVTVEVFDVSGRSVAVLHRGWLEAGVHAVALEGRFPNGIYFLRALGEQESVSRRLVVVR